MATFRKRGDSWEVQIRKQGFSTKTKTFKTKAHAEKWAKQTEVQLEALKTFAGEEASTILLRELIERYKREITPRKRSAWLEEGILDRLLRHSICDCSLAKLTGKKIAEYRDERLKKVSGSTFNREFTIFRHVIEIARKEWNGDHDRAVQLYTKILLTATGDTKKQAQELLGVTRERKGQMAHAVAEYEKFLKEYPEGPDADRVRQRLAGITTASKGPKEKLVVSGKTKEPSDSKGWTSRYYGGFSQFYYYDKMAIDAGDSVTNRNDLTSDVNLNARWNNDRYEYRLQLIDSYENTFLAGEDNENRLNRFFVEGSDKELGLTARLGRQSSTAGGVLGRFDGVRLSYDIFPDIKLNTVYGHPVESLRQSKINSERTFYGLNADFDTFGGEWKFSPYVLKQENHGLTDREAAGYEVNYQSEKTSAYHLLDYDFFYNQVNIFMINGNWTPWEGTILNIVFDHRKSPLLATENSIQGQGVDNFEDLFAIYTDDELKQLAQDRSATSTMASVGITQDLRKDLQLVSDLTMSKIGSTPASGGVDAMPSTGMEFYWTGQLIYNNFLWADDVMLWGLRYSTTDSYNNYTVDLNERFPLGEKLRLNPRFRVDYRTDKDDSDTRMTLRPKIRLDYRLEQWLRLESELGMEWVKNSSGASSQDYRDVSIYAGYRVNF